MRPIRPIAVVVWNAELQERFVSLCEWELGDVPALKLEARLHEKLGVLVLYVNAPKSISGAACSVALKWRLFQLGWLEKEALEAIRDSRLTANGRPKEQQALPRLYSADFAKRCHAAIAKGDMSVRRVASLLDLNIEYLGELFASYRLSAPFDT